jgi:GT2 family glycosyltransferase
MNRLFHLRETLLSNIENNIDENVEFVLLDYNSTDGLENWVRTKLAHYISNGIVKYVKTDEPECFRRSHSRNLAVNCASGEIIILNDADNYLGSNYISWVRNMFAEHGDEIVITTISRVMAPFRDQGGKISFLKSKFIKLGGFDESMIGYGFEDIDLVDRLESSGCSRIAINKSEFLQFINHSQLERISNEYLINNIDTIFTSAMDEPDKTKYSLYLMSDGTFSHVQFLYKENNAKIIDQDSSYAFNLSYHGYEIVNGGVKQGSYNWVNNKLELITSQGESVFLNKVNDIGDCLSDMHDTMAWSKLSEEVEVYTENLLLYTECWNRLKFNENRKGTTLVNRRPWGQGAVSINFSNSLTYINDENAELN